MMIKRLGLLLCLLATQSHAYDITLYVRGVVTAGGCALAQESKSQNIILGAITSDILRKPDASGNRQRFQINVVNCTSDTGGVRIQFVGRPDADNPELLAIEPDPDAATGVAVELLDHDGVRLPINEQGRVRFIEDDSVTSHSLEFYAQYKATGASVTSGSANASATFYVEYE